MDFQNIKIIRATTYAERAGACYVRIQAMAVKHHISLEKEFDEYDELSENNLLNQILKTTVMLLLRHARVDQEYKNDLKKKMLMRMTGSAYCRY